MIASHTQVSEVAVVGLRDSVRGHVPVAFIVLNDDCKTMQCIVEYEIKDLVEKMLGTVASFKSAICVNKLPKSRSGKIMRSLLRKILNHDKYSIPSTLEDPMSVSNVEKVIKCHRLYWEL